MEHLGISFDIKNHPELDPGFLPLHSFNKAFLSDAKKPLGIAVERADGQMAAVETFIHGTPELRAADEYYVNRLVKTILWMKGGYKIYVRGDDSIRDYLQSVFCAGGQQEFDWDYMAHVFEQPFEVVSVDVLPGAKDSPKAIGGPLAAASASTRAAVTGRSPPSSTGSRSTPRRSCGSRKRTATRTTTITALLPRSNPRRSTCPGWTRWASPRRACTSKTAR